LKVVEGSKISYEFLIFHEQIFAHPLVLALSITPQFGVCAGPLSFGF